MDGAKYVAVGFIPDGGGFRHHRLALCGKAGYSQAQGQDERIELLDWHGALNGGTVFCRNLESNMWQDREGNASVAQSAYTEQRTPQIKNGL
jgi:hypothetical protein